MNREELEDLIVTAIDSVHDRDVTFEDYARAVADVVMPMPPVWRGMESAPKNDLIDIFLSDGVRWCDCYHDRITDTWRTSRPSGRLLSIHARFVTHWMPRPPAPEAGR